MQHRTAPLNVPAAMPVRAAIRIVVAAALFALCTSGRAEAANCTLSTTGVVFGTYNVFSTAPVDSTGTLTYDCNGNVDIMVSITQGLSGTFLPRTMAKGSERFAYNLFRDAARSVVWGDMSAGTSAFIDTKVDKRGETVTIYGRIPPQQDIGAGSYSDTLTVVVNF